VADRLVTAGVYGRIVGSRLRSQLAYRVSFALDVVAQAIGQGIELFAIAVVFTQISSLGGFTGGEVLLIFGLAACGFGVADLCVGAVERLPEYIRTGEFDVMLLRPLGTLAQLVCADIALKRLGRVLVGLAVYLWSLASLDLPWTPLRVLVAVIAPLIGAAIMGALFVAANAVSFWVVDGREMANVLTYGSSFTTSYPITVYGPQLRRLMCYVVPGAFVAYFPVLALLDRPDPLGLPVGLRYAGPLVALLAVAVAAVIWRLGVRHYQGTGS
jgi:ABC-2 type transport system permease protein